MKNEQFDKILKDTIDKSSNILNDKAEEYARGDRLHNFKIAEALSDSTPDMALRGMLAKHIVSVWDLIADIDKGNVATAQMWDEKIMDSINYLILLRALVAERLEISDMFDKIMLDIKAKESSVQGNENS